MFNLTVQYLLIFFIYLYYHEWASASRKSGARTLLYKYKTDEHDEVYAFLRLRLQSIVSEFVRDLFHAASSQTPKHPPMLMEKFNGLELDELKRMLLDVVNETSIKELVENGDYLNAKLARDFSRKVIAAKE